MDTACPQLRFLVPTVKGLQTGRCHYLHLFLNLVVLLRSCTLRELLLKQGLTLHVDACDRGQ